MVPAPPLKPDKLVKDARQLAAPFRVTSGKNFRLADYDPGDTLRFDRKDKDRAREALAQGVQALSLLQDKLYAQDHWAVLLIFQALDAAGKDGAIKHVMSGVNPQGCEVHSFKAPTGEELDHDFLWRCSTRVPERGRIGIFNRSYCEETVRHTGTRDSPWYVIPADNKWFTRGAAAVIDALDSLDLSNPKIGKRQWRELAAAGKKLLAEK